MRKLTALLFLLPSLVHASGIYNPGSSGGGGGGSGIVSPGTFTWTNSFGITGLPSGTTTSAAATWQQTEWSLAQNIFKNGGFEIWRFGTSIPYINAATAQQATDGWMFNSAARDDNLLTVSREASTIHDGQYALKMLAAPTFNGGDSTDIKQTLNPYEYAGSSVSISIWLNASNSGTIRLSDDASNTDVGYSGAGWQRVTLNKFVKVGNATQLIFQIFASLQAGNTIYVDSAMMVKGDVPFDWIPRPLSDEVANTTAEAASTTGDRLGVGNNTSAAAGSIGEYVESVVSAVNVGATLAYNDLTSISLTAGDWDVTLVAGMNGVGAFSSFGAGISTTAGNSSSGLVDASNSIQTTDSVAFPNRDYITIPVYRMSLSATTTVYAKQTCTYSGSTPSGRGRLSARRVR